MIAPHGRTKSDAEIFVVVKKRGEIAQGGASYPPDDQTEGCQNSRGGAGTPPGPPLKPPLLK